MTEEHINFNEEEIMALKEVMTEEHINFNEEEIMALKEVIADRIWWSGALKRIKKISVIAGSAFALLAFLALWWPWITRIMQFLIKDAPQ